MLASPAPSGTQISSRTASKVFACSSDKPALQVGRRPHFGGKIPGLAQHLAHVAGKPGVMLDEQDLQWLLRHNQFILAGHPLDAAQTIRIAGLSAAVAEPWFSQPVGRVVRAVNAEDRRDLVGFSAGRRRFQLTRRYFPVPSLDFKPARAFCASG